MIKNIIKDLTQFLKKPNDVQLKINLKQKLSIVSILLLTELIFTLLIIFPLDYGIHEILNIKDNKFDYSNTLVKTIFVWIIFVPLLEELLFRYFLRYQGLKIKIISEAKWKNIFPFLVYLFAVSFGFMHLSNFLNNDNLFYILAPFIIISQLLGGLVITFIRVRLNFKWAVLYHWMWNLIFAVVIPLIESEFHKPFVESTSFHSIVVKESPFFINNKPQIMKIDSVKNKMYSIYIEQYSLQNILDTLYRKDSYYIDDVLVNLNFKSKDGITKQNFLKILKKEYMIK